MFEDKRSKKLIFVAHCILNQNAKLDRCAHYPGAIRNVAEILVAGEAGIVQLPCPEFLYLGLDRQATPDREASIEAEDTRIAGRMAEAGARTMCAQLAHNFVEQIEEYRKHGFETVGVIGINGSPTCGVETTWSNGREIEGRGVLFEALREMFEQSGLSIPLKGIKAYEPEKAVATVTELIDMPPGTDKLRIS